jgi:hypothetical protein
LVVPVLNNPSAPASRSSLRKLQKFKFLSHTPLFQTDNRLGSDCRFLLLSPAELGLGAGFRE